MGIKDIWTKTSNWLRNHSLAKAPEDQPQVDDQGLITEDADSTESTADSQGAQSGSVVVKAVQPRSKAESLEKLQAGFDKLIDKLQGINEHLNRQITQNEELMSRIEQLPQLLEGFPALLENQRQITERLLEQLNAAAVKNEQFIGIVEKIPTETAKQTDALVNIDHQLAAAADIDVQMAESFNKFNETLGKLNQSTVAQTDSMIQMSKTYATSDRYLKYIISRQNKRFIWVFIAAVSVCLAVILILTGIIIYLKQ
jgi:chromosome segregation ATPase